MKTSKNSAIEKKSSTNSAIKNYLKSKALAWIAFALVIVVLVLTFLLHTPWWTFIDIFFAFLMAFFHLMAVYMHKIPHMSRQLDLWAMIFGILCVLSMIGIYIAECFVFDL